MKKTSNVLSVGLVVLSGGLILVTFANAEAPKKEITPAVSSTNIASALPAEMVVASPAVAQMDRALVLFSQQQYGSALQEFSTLVQQFPNSPRREEALFRIAECYRLLNQSQDAVAAYRFFISQYQTSLMGPQALLRLGELLMGSKDYAGAVDALKEAVKATDDATKTIATYQLSQSLLQLSKIDEAIVLLEKLAQANPQNTYSAPAALSLADALDKQGKQKEALPWWQKALAISETKAIQSQAAARGGWTALQLNNLREAEMLFETCRRLDAASDWRKIANTGLLRIRFEQKRHEEVVELFRQERQHMLDSARADVFFAVGQSYFSLKRYQETVEIVDLFLKDFPDHPLTSVAAYSKLLSKISLDKDAVASETAAYLAAYPKSTFVSNVQWLRAQNFSARGKFAEVAGMWEALAQSNPPDLPRDQILFEWGRSLFQIKRWQEAAAAHALFLKENPKHPLVLASLMQRAASLAEVKDTQVLSAWEEVRKAAPESSAERQTALEQLALGYLQSKQNPQMEACFEELIQKFPQSKLRGLGSYQLGVLASEKGQAKVALKHFANAREWDPGTWRVGATQRMALLAYEIRDPEQVAQYVAEYEEAISKTPGAQPLPAALYFWLGQHHYDRGAHQRALTYFSAVNSHSAPGEFRLPAWWYLGESQRALKQWKSAVSSYERYRQLSPQRAGQSDVLLALAHAQFGAGMLDPAREGVEKVMLQDPEGPLNAQARLLFAEILATKGDTLGAAKAFATLSLIYRDPLITPRAMKRAAECYEKAGDVVSAVDWKQRLKEYNANTAKPKN